MKIFGDDLSAGRPACLDENETQRISAPVWSKSRRIFLVNLSSFARPRRPTLCALSETADEAACIELGAEGKIRVTSLAAYNMSQYVMGRIVDSDLPGRQMTNGLRETLFVELAAIVMSDAASASCIVVTSVANCPPKCSGASFDHQFTL